MEVDNISKETRKRALEKTNSMLKKQHNTIIIPAGTNGTKNDINLLNTANKKTSENNPSY